MRSDCQFYSLHTEGQAQDVVGAGVQDCLICQYDLIKDFLGLAMAIKQLGIGRCVYFTSDSRVTGLVLLKTLPEVLPRGSRLPPRPN